MKVTTKSSRARGQALLFAVLLMVFAALLGATFVTVVSLNLNQTDRSVARTDAVTAAQAGMKFVDDQIVRNSVDGESWRPEKIAPPPARGELSYNEYYTPFEQAQGWQMPDAFTYGSAVTPEDRWIALRNWKVSHPFDRFFVKFPDPRGKETTGPVSLVEVSTEQSGDKAGMLRLTVIGRSEDNDTAFARLVAYKPTAQAGGPLAFARYDANYDVAGNKPLTSWGDLATDRKTITIPNALKFAPGVTVAVLKGGTVEFGIVAAVTATTITLKTALTTITAGVIEARAASELADGLLPDSFDADGNGTAGESYEATLQPQRNANSSSGIFINNALFVRQKVALQVNASTNSKLFVSGAIKNETANNSFETINGYSFNSTGANDLIATTTSLAPPALDSRFSRYRRLTAEAAPTSGGVYGYGDGVYIDNREDVEKTGTRDLANWELQRLWQRKPFGTTSLFYPKDTSVNTFPQASGSLEDRGARGWINPWQFLPRGAFVELKGDDIIITRDDRSDALSSGVIPSKFWNSPGGVPQYGTYRQIIRIFPTYHERYFDVNGVLTPILNPARTVPDNVWPDFNGVIFAEGNIRVRGYLKSKNITIASLGTIYVEGNILRDAANPTSPPATAPRIALIAKRNVVINPTMFVGLPTDWRDSNINSGVLNLINLAGTATGVNATQIVGNTADETRQLANLVRLGETVSVSSQSGKTTVVTAIDPVAGITVSPAITPATPTDSAIITNDHLNVFNVDPPVVSGKSTTAPSTVIADESLTSGTYKYMTDERFFQLPPSGGSLSREVRFDRPEGSSGTLPYYLNYFHGAQMRRAFAIQRQDIAIKTATIKKPAASPVIADVEKLLDLGGQASFDLRDVDGSSGPDGDATETISALLTGTGHFPVPDGSGGFWWNYVDDNSAAQPSVGAVAARRLAQTTSPGMSSLNLAGAPYHPVALTTSRSLEWKNDSGTNLSWFGSAPKASPTDPEKDVDGEGVREEFYWRTTTSLVTHSSTREQSLMRMTSRQLTDGSTVPADGWENSLRLRMDEAPLLPCYRVAGPSLSTTDFSSAAGFTPITISVQATIMAQEGSFFVLPAPAMASSLRDLSGDNTVDGKDTGAATVYRRLNYHLEMQGNIAQNLAPTGVADYDTQPDADGQIMGATARWLDAASYPRIASGSPLTTTGFAGGVGAMSFDTVSYVADSVPADTLPLPASPDLLYVG